MSIIEASAPQKITRPEDGSLQALYWKIKEIARVSPSSAATARIFNGKLYQVKPDIFVKQAETLKDITDDYEGSALFQQYYPQYHNLTFEQFRTYLTWRTKVRQGIIQEILPSYAYLYIYELLNNIGFDNPKEGLASLMHFWMKYRRHSNAIDKNMQSWLKDYYVYYGEPQDYNGFFGEYRLEGLFAQVPKKMEGFGLYSAISRYDIKHSVFYREDNAGTIEECFSFVMEKIMNQFSLKGLEFEEAFFHPVRGIYPWIPFEGAVFYPGKKQTDRRIVFSAYDIYICKNNAFFHGNTATSKKGEQFISFVLKKMESNLREVTKYKHKLTANADMMHEDTIRVLTKAGINAEEIIPAAVREFYREATKTIVTVDTEALEKIRREALATQEALIVEEELTTGKLPQISEDIFEDAPEEPAPATDSWAKLAASLSESERRAVSIMLAGGDIKAFADECGEMLEVLIERINETAVDCIGDNIIDEDCAIYEDCKANVRKMLSN